MTTFAAFGLSLLLIEPPTTVPSTTFASATVIEDCRAVDPELRARTVPLVEAEPT